MIRCACIGCSAVVEAADDAAGTVVLCARCGYLVQVPEPSRTATAPGSSSAPSRNAVPPRPSRRGSYVLGGMHAVFLLCLPFALVHAKDGTPLCLTMFALNLLLATVAGFLFLAGMHTPEYLADWLRMPFTRPRALLLLLPLAVLGFLVAVHVYSP